MEPFKFGRWIRETSHNLASLTRSGGSSIITHGAGLAAHSRMLSVPHLIVLFVVVLVVFGPDKLPDLARNLGKVMAEFRRLTNEMRFTFEEHLREIERDSITRRTTAPPAPGAANARSTPAPVGAPPAGISTPEHHPENTIAGRRPNAAALPEAPTGASPDSRLDAAHEPLAHLADPPSAESHMAEHLALPSVTFSAAGEHEASPAAGAAEGSAGEDTVGTDSASDSAVNTPDKVSDGQHSS
jgi:sec-independent protein translocase protein TatB